jgi:hypothetical protein
MAQPADGDKFDVEFVLEAPAGAPQSVLEEEEDSFNLLGLRLAAARPEDQAACGCAVVLAGTVPRSIAAIATGEERARLPTLEVPPARLAPLLRIGDGVARIKDKDVAKLSLIEVQAELYAAVAASELKEDGDDEDAE